MARVMAVHLTRVAYKMATSQHGCICRSRFLWRVGEFLNAPAARCLRSRVRSSLEKILLKFRNGTILGRSSIILHLATKVEDRLLSAVRSCPLTILILSCTPYITHNRVTPFCQHV